MFTYIRRRLSFLFRQERGNAADIMGLFFFGYFGVVIVAFIVNFIIASIYQSDLNYAAKQEMGVMTVQNGADAGSEQRFRDMIRTMGHDPSKVTFAATPKLVQRYDPLTIHYTSSYPLWAYKLLGIMNETLKIDETIPGTARILLRGGD
ncbi:hypothetical protein QCD85_06130 [Paenibacillus sp. PsM32]|uniref:hypothetical protein n=1 Tax=unclassified Paenibacillus TaxID=185978 RepID=UPI002365D69C|nr:MULTISPECIES: hypothetical protein [unclassified Paenibacillus]MDN4617668.1 hypothetical protein [Paenibacillus sp. PsM32]WDF52875.1 hypothetical protein PQ460_10815 [Paenibacillus sp. KACC 21273]